MKWRLFSLSPRGRLLRRSRRALRALFADAALLKGTSLRPDHAGRVQLLDVEEEPWRIGFGIIRHPRPHAFSKQVHEVLELWIYDVDDGALTRVKGHNLTRAKGSDGEPSIHGPGI